MFSEKDGIESRFKRFTLTEQQKRTATVLLQIDGVQRRSVKETVTAVFGAEAIKDEKAKASHYGIIFHSWESIERKISLALSLPAPEWEILIRIDSWWRVFNEKFGHCAMIEIVELRKSLMPGANQTKYEPLRSYEVDLESQLRKLALTPIQEFIATKAFQLCEQRKWTIYALAELLIKFRSANDKLPPTTEIKDNQIAVKNILAAIKRKVEIAVELPAHERSILESLNPWYKRLFSAYPRLSKSEIDEFIKNCFGIAGHGKRTRKERPPNSPGAARRKAGKPKKEKIREEELNALALWRQALARSAKCANNRLLIPAKALNQQMQETVFNRGLVTADKMARRLRKIGEIYGFELMDLVQEAAVAWWAMLTEWPGGSARDFRAFVRETAASAIRATFSHPALTGPSSAVPIMELKAFMKKAVSHRLMYGEDLSLAQLREMFGWTDEQFKRFQDLTRLSWRHFVSISEPAFDDEGRGESETKETRIRSDAPTPEEIMIGIQRSIAQNMIASWIEGPLNELLAPLEQLILRYRFGFNAENSETLSVEDVAEILDTPVEVIVRLEDQAIAKLQRDEELTKRYDVSLKMLKQAEKQWR